MLPPSPLKIVRLDSIHAPAPTFTIPHTYTEYPTTPNHQSTIISRISSADVVITTRVPITAATLSQCPNLKLIAVLAIGFDMIDLAACKERGVCVCNVPAASITSVSEHALALYFSVRRNVVQLHNLTVQGSEWAKRGSLISFFGGLPRSCGEEVMGIFGAGVLGSRVAALARALGMHVLLAEHKPTPSNPSPTIRPGRTSFTETLSTSTIIMLTLPLTPSTLNLISTPEFALMRSDAILVNVARGGIVDENALVDALREGRIAGAATDVFLEEPATGENNVLVRAAAAAEGEDGGEGMNGGNGLKGKLVLSPHVAWYARSSIEKLRSMVTENIEGWSRGEARNLVG